MTVSKTWLKTAQVNTQEHLTTRTRASLVLQWWRICLPTQKTQLWSTKIHILWSHCTLAPQLLSLCSLTGETTKMRSPHTATVNSSFCSLQLEKSLHSNEDPAQPKINIWNYEITSYIHTYIHTFIHIHIHIYIYIYIYKKNTHSFGLPW